MNTEKALAIFSHFAVEDEVVDIRPFGGGHINDTYLVTCANSKYTLQRINDAVFTRPEARLILEGGAAASTVVIGVPDHRIVFA